MPHHLLSSHPPDSAALVAGDRTVSYGELADQVERTAGGLVAMGIAPGDRVAVVGGNETAFVTGYLGAQAAGAVACPVFSRLPEAELRERLEAVRPVAALVSPSWAELGRAAADGLIDDARISTAQGHRSPDLRPLPEAEPVSAIQTGGDRAAAILHTSGVVGAPRAAVLTYDDLRLAQQRIIDLGPGLTPADVSLAVLPLTHVLGLNMCLLPSLRVGATVVLQSDLDPEAVLDTIERNRVTHLVAVPPMWHAWAAAVVDGDASADALSSVTFARAGASALHPKVADSVHAAFGFDLGQGYGLTETAGTVTYEPNARRSPGSVGRPLPGVELRLVEDGEPVEVGDRGEIWIRTPSVFHGYLDDAAGTAEVLISDGWCRTGDVGVQGDDGTLYLVGRSKDLINVSGFNVYPVEVETALEAHPDISEAMVVGEPHEVTGEQIVAFVKSDTVDELDPADLVAHCRRLIARYKIPSAIHVVDRLPLTAAGKRVRNELRSSG